MNYYQILNVHKFSTTKEIRKKYFELAKLYHPDKNKNISHIKFQKLTEAYSILSNPAKRYNYDIKLEYHNLFQFNSKFQFNFTDNDLLILHYFYSKFKTSVEFRFLKLLYESLPKNYKIQFCKKYSIIDITPIKYIDATHLYNNYTIILNRTFNDVYLNICKQIIILTQKYYYHLFITHSDYTIIMKNILNTNIKIQIETISNNFHINNYDLYLQQNINVYKFLFENIFTIKLPKQTYEYSILDFKTYKIKNAGLHNPSLNLRGNIYITHHSNLPAQRNSILHNITPSQKYLLHKLFNLS